LTICINIISFFSDIIAGGGLGILCAFVSYISYYQNPFSKRAGQYRVAGEQRRTDAGVNDALL
jgi:hypothetical protein